jgi:Zn-dependent protease with chaperone function
MTPLFLAALVGLASFFALSTLLTAGVAAWWRLARPTTMDANRLLALRLLPAAGGFLVTMCLVLPAFLRFEPVYDGEQPGPVLLFLSAAGASVVLAGLVRMARAVILTRRLRRRWLASASTVPQFLVRHSALREGGDGRMPAHLIDVPYPVVAIIGILRPLLVVSRTVAGGCSVNEVQLIAAHERAHLYAHDNLKRLLIDGCPDVLRWTATGRAIAAAWSAAAEDAADDAATSGDRHARIALASVLLRVARMAIGESPAPQFASALVGLTGVERRVRRLAESRPRPQAPRVGLGVALGALLVIVAGAAANDDLLALTYSTAELIVGLGR